MAPGSLRGRLDRSLERTVLLVLSAWGLLTAGLVLAFVRVSPIAVAAAGPPVLAGLVLGIKRVSSRSTGKVRAVLYLVFATILGLLVTASWLST